MECVSQVGSRTDALAMSIAGAKEVLSTLCMGNETTRVLMSEFYRAVLSEGRSPLKALRKAVVTALSAIITSSKGRFPRDCGFVLSCFDLACRNKNSE